MRSELSESPEEKRGGALEKLLLLTKRSNPSKEKIGRNIKELLDEMGVRTDPVDKNSIGVLEIFPYTEKGGHLAYTCSFNEKPNVDDELGEKGFAVAKEPDGKIIIKILKKEIK